MMINAQTTSYMILGTIMGVTTGAALGVAKVSEICVHEQLSGFFFEKAKNTMSNANGSLAVKKCREYLPFVTAATLGVLGLNIGMIFGNVLIPIFEPRRIVN